jgi:hypothetical protein
MSTKKLSTLAVGAAPPNNTLPGSTDSTISCWGTESCISLRNNVTKEGQSNVANVVFKTSENSENPIGSGREPRTQHTAIKHGGGLVGAAVGVAVVLEPVKVLDVVAEELAVLDVPERVVDAAGCVVTAGVVAPFVVETTVVSETTLIAPNMSALVGTSL